MSLPRLRAENAELRKADSESGFTLIELLVVMLILGILAAIALPAFFNQKGKAVDAKAKENAHSAQVAMETCAGESPIGSYEKCTAESLRKIEPTLPPIAEKNSTGETLTVSGTGQSAFTVTIASANGNTFSVKKSSGEVKFECTVAEKNGTNRAGCPASGSWSG